ncbi:MAG: hypothetical protein O3A22_00510 [Bacteroidetes bacterium]|jgi:hypothetical protein|nr:hypothetical protein [Bacteroidota bacterium]
MKDNFLLVSLAAMTMIFISSCNKDTEPGIVLLNTELSWSGETISIGDTVTDHMGHDVRPEKLSCYVSNISLRHVSGEWINSESISRLDFITNSATANGEFSKKSLRVCNEFNALRFDVGVPSEMNTMSLNTSLPSDDPLSVSGAAGMTWDMMGSYFFVKCEGKLAESEGGVIETPYIFHPASNALYRTITLDLNESIVLNQDETIEFMLDLDLRKAFEGPSIEDNLDLSEVGHSMGPVPNAIQFVDNFSLSWTLK